MTRILLLLFILLATSTLIAQTPPMICPGGNLVVAGTCQEACIVCQDMDGFVGSNSFPSDIDAPPGFCAPEWHNIQWVGFLAGSNSIVMDITVSDCLQGDGLQIGIYGSLDCQTFQPVSNCDPGIANGATVTFFASGLVIGNPYYLVIDGNFNDICDFTVDITSGSTEAPPVTQAPSFFPPPNMCPGGTFTFQAGTVPNASIYTWTINGQEVAYSQIADLSFPAAGTYTVCCTASNPCNPVGATTCTQVTVAEPPTQFLDETICLGETFTVGTQVFSQTGFYSVPVTLPDGCIEITNLNLVVEPPQFGFDQQTLCPGESYWVGTPGQPGSQLFTYFDNPGQYEVFAQSANGCDSIITFTLEIGAPGIEIDNVNICDGESVISNGNTYTESGTYVHELTSVSGCDSTYVLVLQVDEQPLPAYIEATICEGEFYFLGNAAYNQTGLYNGTVQTSGGCDSIVTLNLTVSAPETELNEIICPGESFSVGNNTYNATGTYIENLTSSLGCDSTVTLNLEVLSEIETNLTEEICDGNSYTVGSSSYSSTGNYTDVLTAANGCDSTVYLDLTVNPTLTTNLVETVCNGGSFSIGGSTYSATGTYQEMLSSQVTGCDSLVNLDLTVLDAIETDLTAEICDQEIYTVGTTDFDQAGDYEVTLQAANGCDSTVFLDLEVIPIPETFLTEAVCDGQTFSVGNSTYDTQGEYTDILTSSSGCDSIVYLDLTILSLQSVTLNVGICTGQTYTLGSDNYDTAGTYSATFTSSYGCDSTVTVNLTVEDVLEEFITVEICEGESYSVGSSTYNTTGNYQDQFVTADGCDSILYLDLIVYETIQTSLTESICDGESVSVGSSTYNTTGVFTDVLTSTVTNCDSVVTLNLTVLEQPVTNLSEMICDGETFSIAGVSYNSTGTFQEVIPAANGCDSTINLTLIVLDVPQTSLVESICDGTAYAVGDSTYTQAGIYQNILVAANGCDSIVSLDLSILDVPETELTELICDGETFTVGNSSFSSSGTFVETLTAANGCDSTVTLNLTVAPIPNTDLVASICVGASYTVGTSTYNATGNYQDILTSSVGCDSIVNLALTVTDFYEINLVESICDGQTYSVGASTYSSTGVYQDMFTSSDGCDSIVNLDLTVFEIPVTNLTEVLCDGETYSVGASTYNSTGVFQDILTSVVTGCDSIVNLDLTVNPTFETTLVEAICDGETYEVGGSSYAETGSYQDLLIASNGCDSMVNLSLTVNPIQQTDLVETLCFGETYTVGTTTFAQTGIYQEILPSVVTGCDSIVNLDLTVPDLIQTNLSETLCFGETYSVGASTYTSTGIYQDVLTAANGCDSLVNLDLVIREDVQTELIEQICVGETYAVGSSEYTASGIYQDVLTSVLTGCDSTVNLDLTVIVVEETVLTQSICDGESVTIGPSTYTETGSYQDVLTSVVSGCDSVVSLDLTVFEIPQTDLVEEVCFGETYTVGNTTFSQTGIYQEILTSVITGCDSIVNLDLTVPNLITTSFTQTICFGESYTVGSSVYSETGSYQDVLTAENGCDSIVNLGLFVRDEILTNLTQEICEGNTYEVGQSVYNESGSYQDILTSINTGCDSTVNLDLTVIPLAETMLSESICDGEAVVVGTSVYTTSGSYQDVLTSTLTGCDSVVYLELDVIPIPEVELTESICDGESYTVGGTAYTTTGTFTNILDASTGCDSIVTLDLTVIPIPETFLVEEICQGETFTVGTSSYDSNGDFTDILEASSGCDSIVYLELTVNEVYEVFLDEIICDGDNFPVGDNSFSTSGSYVENLTTVNGCDSVVFLALTVHPCELSFAPDSESTNCNDGSDGSISFSITVGTPPYDFNWQSADGNTSGEGQVADNDLNTVIQDLPAGLYTFNFVDSFDVEGSFQIVVEEPTPVQVALEPSMYDDYNISCVNETDGMIMAMPSGGTPPYSYSWNTGNSLAVIENLPAGSYEVTVTDQNGCMVTMATELTAPEALSAVAEASDPPCFGDNSGSIAINAPAGGVGPYLYALEDEPFSSSPIFPGLTIGEYEVHVQDANGCIWTDYISVDQPEELIVELGDNQRISLGQTATIEAQTSYPVQSYNWKSLDSLSCQDCPTQAVRPFATASYEITVVDENGCTDTDFITIFVGKEREVFIPNVFSPNNDSHNDVFRIFTGDDVARIKSFMVFNRWGESIIELFNFDPNDPGYHWDGTYRGQIMNSGVYVYFAEVEFIDGEVVMFKGDVLLMR